MALKSNFESVSEKNARFPVWLLFKTRDARHVNFILKNVYIWYFVTLSSDLQVVVNHVVGHLLLAAVLPPGGTTEAPDVYGEHVEPNDEAWPGGDK